MSAWTCRSSDGKAAQKIVPPRLRIPYWNGPGADSEEKHEPASDTDTAVVDSLKALDLERPIREADITRLFDHLVGKQQPGWISSPSVLAIFRLMTVLNLTDSEYVMVDGARP